MKNKTRAGALALLIAGALGTGGGIAAAAVTFDAPSGTGFVGKGDVQNAFGWNNATLQANAGGVTFSYSATDEYEAVCTFVTGEGTRGERTHNIDHTRTTAIAGALNGSPRPGPNQFTGFNLTGYAGDPVVSGHAPVEGEACPGNPGTAGTWSAVTLISSTGALSATSGGVTTPLQ